MSSYKLLNMVQFSGQLSIHDYCVESTNLQRYHQQKDGEANQGPDADQTDGVCHARDEKQRSGSQMWCPYRSLKQPLIVVGKKI